MATLGIKKPYPYTHAPISVPHRLAKKSELIRTSIPSFFGPPDYRSNRKVFIKILRFHKPPPATVLDATWGAGEFWRTEQSTLYDVVANYTVIGMDIVKRPRQTILGDCRAIPFNAQSFDVVVYDPPYGGGPQSGIGELDDFYNWQGEDTTFGYGLTLKDLMILTRKLNEEANKILKHDGLLVTKIQDQGRVFLHDLLEGWLTHFNMIDLIIFAAYDHKIMPKAKEEIVRQSLKCHSYFQVWEKK